MTTLKFIPYSSAFDTGFWHELTRRKLEIYRLDSSNQPILGYYSNGTIFSKGQRQRERDQSSFLDANDNMPVIFNVDHQCFDQ